MFNGLMSNVVTSSAIYTAWILSNFQWTHSKSKWHILSLDFFRSTFLSEFQGNLKAAKGNQPC